MNEREREQEVVAQKTMALPFLSDEVPVLYLTDGRPYFPVFAVCHALGICADVHIRRWQRLVLWVTARKLLFVTEKGGKRQVWCLPISHVPFLYSLFDWNLVSSERRSQLHQATEKQAQLANLAYQTMQQHYQTMRQALFRFLTTNAGVDALLQRYAAILLPTLDDESALALTTLLDRGRSLYQEAVAHARKMVYDQGTLPVVDAIKTDAHDNVIETFSMPLLPVISPEDSEQFFLLLARLLAWMQEEQAFWAERGA